MEGILFEGNENIALDGFNNDFFGGPRTGPVNDDLFLDMSSSPLSSPYLDENFNTNTLDNVLNVQMFDQQNYCAVPIDNLVQMDLGALQDILSQGGSAPGSGNQSPIREELDLTSDDVVYLDEEEDKPKKRGRKRQKRDLANENMDVSQVTVSREHLLKITSDEYDNMIKGVTDKRGLTWAESKHIKTQRRLIKNRESAQASRQRKKEHTDTLAKQNEALRMENEALKKDNKSLRDEVMKLTAIIKKTTVSMTPTKNRIVALALIFSFGLLYFGMNKNPGGAPPSVRLHANIGQRNLLEFEQASNESKEQAVSLTPVPTTTKVQTSKLTNRPITTVEPALRIQHQQKIQTFATSTETQKVNIPISENEPREKFIESTFASTTGNDFTTARMEEFSNESNNDNSNFTKNLVIDSESLTKFFDDEVIKYRRNTAYFTASDFQQLTPLQNEAFDPNSPFYVSFIVPSSAMPNSNLASSPPQDISNGVVEINCQVIDVNIGRISAPVAMVS